MFIKNKEEAAQLTIKTLISIIGSDKKINNTEKEVNKEILKKPPTNNYVEDKKEENFLNGS